MAKTEVFDGDPTVVTKAIELKKELQRLVDAIAAADNENFNVEAIDRVAQKLRALKELELKRTVSVRVKETSSLACPEEFRCPLSKELMRDPVIVATGQVSPLPIMVRLPSPSVCPSSLFLFVLSGVFTLFLEIFI